MAKDFPPYIDYPKPRKPITNYDRLISKTPEEMAAQIVEWIEGVDPVCGTLYDNDIDRWIDWLRQEEE